MDAVLPGVQQPAAGGLLLTCISFVAGWHGILRTLTEGLYVAVWVRVLPSNGPVRWQGDYISLTPGLPTAVLASTATHEDDLEAPR